ncbi:MAG: alpha/beta hydrolase [Elainellaceae cyanobacterium]
MNRHQQFSLAIASLTVGLWLSGCQSAWQGIRSDWHQRVLRSQFDDRFTEISCTTFEVPARISKAICGYVTVPELHAQPNGDTLALATVLLPSIGASPAADPLVLAGDLGQSTISTMVPWFIEENPAAQLRNQHDILLIEQRGTQYSKPYLDCPELVPVKTELLKTGQLADPQSRQQLEAPAYQACKDRLETNGVNFDAYNTLESATDVVSVLNSLGFQRVNFYGSSYGSLLAQVLMRQSPNRLRSVILDGTEPASLNSRQYATQASSYSLRQIFTNCLANPQCNQSYPNLESVFLQLVERLNESPQTITVNMGNTPGEFQVPLDGSMFSILVQNQLEGSNFAETLPQNLHGSLRENNYGWLTDAIATEVRSPEAEAMQASVICAQRNAPTEQNPIVQSFFQAPFSQLEAPTRANNLAYCDIYSVATLPDSAYAPVDSMIPTLIMNGQYDNVTPLAFGVLVANNLPNAYIYNYPRVGHGALTVSFSSGQTCPGSMVTAFLENPDQPPNEACIQDMMTTVESPPQRVEIASQPTK